MLFSLPAVLRSLSFSLLARSFRSPALTESQAQVSTGTPHDNLTECYLCHAIRQALVDIVVHLRNHVIGLILQLVANLFTTFQCLFMCAAVSISETCFCWWLEDFCKIKRVWKPKTLCVHLDSYRLQHRGRPRASQRILPFQSIRRYRLTRSSVKGWNSLKANCTFIFIQVFASYMHEDFHMHDREIYFSRLPKLPSYPRQNLECPFKPSLQLVLYGWWPKTSVVVFRRMGSC